ncbi:uncharacterized protein LODBEIA_P28310 [Lodderomyces beijingensis]|uniref:Uncharacterized protein n=1 Tax=Lodderomyces beijingensis TaxID=1775926 RepID=A0ABP0ZKD0_9ASCO
MARRPYKKRSASSASKSSTTTKAASKTFRQNAHQSSGIPRYNSTKYQPQSATLKNFPSSIVNGVTREGGLYSLTLKSINCESYVEMETNMRRAVFNCNVDTPRISTVDMSKFQRDDVDVDVEDEGVRSRIERLKAVNSEISALSRLYDETIHHHHHHQNGGDDAGIEKLGVRVVGHEYVIRRDVAVRGLKVDCAKDEIPLDEPVNEESTAQPQQQQQQPQEEAGLAMETDAVSEPVADTGKIEDGNDEAGDGVVVTQSGSGETAELPPAQVQDTPVPVPAPALPGGTTMELHEVQAVSTSDAPTPANPSVEAVPVPEDATSYTVPFIALEGAEPAPRPADEPMNP